MASQVGKLIMETILGLITTAFAFVAGLAWNNAIQKLIEEVQADLSERTVTVAPEEHPEEEYVSPEEFISSELVASSLTFRLARMLTLHNIVENNPKLIVTCTEGITKQMMSKAKIQAL